MRQGTKKALQSIKAVSLAASCRLTIFICFQYEYQRDGYRRYTGYMHPRHAPVHLLHEFRPAFKPEAANA
jgi:hypothetical protein